MCQMITNNKSGDQQPPQKVATPKSQSSRTKNKPAHNMRLLSVAVCSSLDSEVHIETFVLRGKFSGKITTVQQPPNRYGQC